MKKNHIFDLKGKIKNYYCCCCCSYYYYYESFLKTIITIEEKPYI